MNVVARQMIPAVIITTQPAPVRMALLLASMVSLFAQSGGINLIAAVTGLDQAPDAAALSHGLYIIQIFNRLWFLILQVM